MPKYDNVIPIRLPQQHLADIAASSVRDRRRSERYRKAVMHFLRWLDARNRTAFSAENISRYRQECLARKLHPRKVHTHMSALSRLAETMAQLQRMSAGEAQAIHKACSFPPPKPSPFPTLCDLGFDL